MANLQVKDGAASTKYLKTSGAGSDGDPHIPEHLETNSAAIKTAVETIDNAISGNEMQVDVVTLPASAATLTEQQAQSTLIGAVNETAPASDTASSGLNGRLQRIAQRLTSMIALLPAALTGSGNFKTAVSEALPAGTNNIGDVDIATITLPTTIYNGQKNVTTAGTRVTLASSQSVLSGVTIKAKAANTGSIYVGDSSVSSSTGYILAASDTVFIEVANLATVYLDSSVNGEGVSYIAT